MTTHILGISAYFHDSAAALLRDGEIVAAAQEERFTRRKHDERFPENAVKYCLAEADCDQRKEELQATDDRHLRFLIKRSQLMSQISSLQVFQHRQDTQ